MKNYFSVLKLLLKNMFRKREGKKSSYMLIAYIIIGITALLVSSSVALAMFGLAPQFNDVNILITTLLIATFFIIIFFSLFSMLAHLYFSKDSEFFLSLPIKPSVIYFAKLTIVYLTELILAVLALVPSLIMIGVALSYGVFYYIAVVFIVLTVPMFPLVFTSVIAIPLMYIVSFLKRKGAIASIILIFMFAAFMAGYMYFSISLGSGGAFVADDGGVISTLEFENAFTVWGYVFFPFLSVARFATLAPTYGTLLSSAMINLSIFLGSAVLLFTLALLISNLAYKRGAAKNLENRASNSKKGKDVKRSVTKSLIVFEWREIFRNPTFAFQCLSNVLIAPLMTFLMLFMLNRTGDEVEAISSYIWLIASSIIAFFCVTLNIAAQTAITRQGATFYYSKIIPVDYKTQIKAKLILYMIISSISLTLSTIAVMFFASNWWVAPSMLLYILVLNYSATCFSIWFDLRDPKLDWVTYTEAIKQNKNVMINSLINVCCMFGVLFVSVIINIVCMLFLGDFAPLLAFFILALIMLIPATICHKALFKNLDAKYWNLP